MTGLLPKSWLEERVEEDGIFTHLCCLVNCGQFLCSFIAKIKDILRSHIVEKLKSQDFFQIILF